VTPIGELPITVRKDILNSWANGSIAQLRGLFKLLCSLGRILHLLSSTTFNSLAGFPAVPNAWDPKPSFPFEFLQFTDQSVTVDTDIVIVGSGCGAGVCAANLTAAGYKVLVVEKGYHFGAEAFPMAQSEALTNLLEPPAIMVSDDSSIAAVAGSCFGGGGTVNWSAALQTPGAVRDEWTHQRGLGFFASSAFQSCLDRVCQRMGVDPNSDDVVLNHRNRVLLEGARRLGWSAKKVPQNIGGQAHDDGHCTLGCCGGQKMGPVNGWFPAAAEKGARFVEGLQVQRILFDMVKGKKVACGVEGTWTSRGKDGVNGQGKTTANVVIRAKRVVVWSVPLVQYIPYRH
jgi:choline dehydrogenase-like flavoprotein